MTEVDDQRLLVTLVHGTWGRYRLRKNAPFWFEHESPFCKRLGAEFTSRNISYRLNPFLWSGANSVFARDEAARALAQHMITEHCAKPYATQIIVAHSHGGNIALLYGPDDAITDSRSRAVEQMALGHPFRVFNRLALSMSMRLSYRVRPPYDKVRAAADARGSPAADGSASMDCT